MQKLRGYAMWPIWAAIARAAKQGNLQEVPKKKKKKTALNIYKGQRKPMQNNIVVSKVVCFYPLSQPATLPRE